MTNKQGFKEFELLASSVDDDLNSNNFWGAFSELFQAINLATTLADGVDIIELSNELDKLHTVDELASYYRGSFASLASYVHTFNLSRFFK